MSEHLYYEDITPGDRHRGGKSVTLTDETIRAFAGSFDPQPFHLDEAAAAQSMFGGLAASGWHTAALTMQLLVTDGPRFAWGIIGAGVEELRWPRPVRPGDTLSLRAEVVEKRPMRSRPGVGIIRARVITQNQDGQPVQSMIANLVVPMREAERAG